MGTGAVAYGGLYAWLGTVWYAQQPRGSWRWFDDGAEWQQLDKMGHAYWAYQESRLMMDLLHWSGVKRTPRILLGGLTGFLLQSPVEILDGYVPTYGASGWDLLANASGSAIAITNELVWGEQRLQFKFSFFPSTYARQRPEILGSGVEEVIKDYNGQTYWVSAPIKPFFRHGENKLPPWLCVSVGYSGNGMLGGYYQDPWPDVHAREHRQWLLSVDVDWTKIKTGSGFLRMIFYLANMLKLPAPALSLENGQIRAYGLFY